jgi:hypothetical protein
VSQLQFAQVERCDTEIGEPFQELQLGTPESRAAAPDDNSPISYNFLEVARWIFEAIASGVAFRAERTSSGAENVTWLFGRFVAIILLPALAEKLSPLRTEDDDPPALSPGAPG